MDENKGHLEANLARLVRSAAGGEAQIRESLRERTWHRLVAESHRGRQASPFPDLVLAFSGGILALAALWHGMFTGGITGTRGVPDFFVVLPVTVNLLCLPVTAALLLQRRRGHVQAA